MHGARTRAHSNVYIGITFNFDGNPGDIHMCIKVYQNWIFCRALFHGLADNMQGAYIYTCQWKVFDRFKQYNLANCVNIIQLNSTCPMVRTIKNDH